MNELAVLIAVEMVERALALARREPFFDGLDHVGLGEHHGVVELAARTSEAESRIGAAVAEAESNLRSIAAAAAQQVTAKLLGREVPRDQIEAALSTAGSGRS